MRSAWRIVKQSRSGTAFDGEGAYRFGGRWNSRGVRVVYTSATLSLAALETLVHLPMPVVVRYVAFRLDFPESLVETLPAAALPAGWFDEPPPPVAPAVGDRWMRDGRSAVLEVPSVLVRCESNYILNPAHRDFRRLKISAPRPFAFDPRLL